MLKTITVPQCEHLQLSVESSLTSKMSCRSLMIAMVAIKKPSRFGLGFGCWWWPLKAGWPLFHAARSSSLSSFSSSANVSTFSAIPDAMAGVAPLSVWCLRQKL